MVPRPAQNLTIEQGAGAFRRAAVPDPPHRSKALWEQRTLRKRCQHPVLFAALQHPPKRIRPAHARGRLQESRLPFHGAAIKLDDNTRGHRHARGVGCGTVRQIHHRMRTCRSGGDPRGCGAR